MSEVAPIRSDARYDWPWLLQRGVGDIADGFARHQIWMFLGLREVRKQYQRSLLGPFWLTLNMGILVGALGWFYSQIFAQDIREFLPHVTLGFIVWGLIGGLLTESCLVFTSASVSIRQAPMPLSVYAYQLTWRHFVIFCHNLCIFVLVTLILGLRPGTTLFVGLLGVLIILANGFCLGLTLGPLAARFRDIPPIMASFTQILFFLTPVFWTTASLPDRAIFVYFNPFFHFLELVRQPFLGEMPTALNWSVCLGLTLLNLIAATLFFSRFRARIPYWA